jgi:uncharacterized protein (TIGR03435 family)
MSFIVENDAGHQVQFSTATVVVFSLTCALLAQAAATFDVVSIKANHGGTLGSSMSTRTGGLLTATNISVRSLITAAYDVRPSQVVGPSWIDTDRFDINARAAGDVPGTAFPPMMQRMLAERFQLAVHHETREMPVYALVPRVAGQLGPKLTASPADCVQVATPGQPNPCGSGVSASLTNGNGTMVCRRASMEAVARSLGGQVDRIVIDRTGLAGSFDCELKFTPEDRGPADTRNADAPSVFTAVQEQWGLKLDATRGPVDVVVIDRVERPTED